MVLLSTNRRRRTRNQTSIPPAKDWWDKASIVSSFMASVVIALVGLLISYTIQNTQIETAAANAREQIQAAARQAEDDRRVHQGQLTAELVQHLTSEDVTKRAIAIIALRRAVPPETYDQVVKILAHSDGDASIRALAIDQLSGSNTQAVATTLSQIATDPKRSQPERTKAASAAVEVTVRQLAGSATKRDRTTFVLGASGAGVAYDRPELGHGVFTYWLLKGLGGEADANSDGVLKASEVGAYVVAKVVDYTDGAQEPVVVKRGAEDITVGATLRAKPMSRPKIRGLLIGTYPQIRIPHVEREWTPLPFVANDATALAEALKALTVAEVEVLVGTAATREAVLMALNRLEAESADDDICILYFSGHSSVRKGGIVEWLLADSSDRQLGLTADDIQNFMTRTRAARIIMLFDSCDVVTPGLL